MEHTINNAKNTRAFKLRSDDTDGLRHELNSSIAPVELKVTCAFCITTGMHHVVSYTERTVDFKCFFCGRNFFVFKSKIDPTDYQHEAISPKANIASPDSCWVPYGKTVFLGGYTIPGGLIYYGCGLKSIYDRTVVEHSLIDPNLPVYGDVSGRDARRMTAWFSYSQISPSYRAAFIEWHADGRKDPKAHIGHVLLFFFGLERRALHDATFSDSASGDIPAIMEEVVRLLAIYGDSVLFRKRATGFLDILKLTQTTAPLYHILPRFEPNSNEVPLVLKIALGQMAVDKVPFSVEWALALAENTQGMPRRHLELCPDEFRELFKIRYREKYANGFILEQNKTVIQATYRPASASFGGNVKISLPDLPDVTVAADTSNKLWEIAIACTDEFEDYLRYLGRNPKGKGSFEASTYLPLPLLISKFAHTDVQNMTKWFDENITADGFVIITYSALLQVIPYLSFGTNGKSIVAKFLRRMKIAIEPDLRLNKSLKPEQDVILFRFSSNAKSSCSQEYLAASLAVHLASAVAWAGGTVDANQERYILEYIEHESVLTDLEKVRLCVHTKRLLSLFPGMTGVKGGISIIKHDQKESLGRLLVGVAQADGHIDPAEIKTLSKLYNMLGLDSQCLYSHAHAAAIEPVTVRSAECFKSLGYSIPVPPKPTTGVFLDMSCVEAKLAETVAVSAILNNIFTEQDPVQNKTSMPVQTPIPEALSASASIAGLDPGRFAFMQVLAGKLVWTREELERLAADHRLMLDGTLDTINDASFDHFGGLFAEGEDPIEINAEFAKEIAA